MEVQIELLGDGRYKFGSSLLSQFKNLSKKFFECDAFIAALVLDPRFSWSEDSELFNLELRDRGIVS